MRTRIGQYVTERVLGEGSAAVVYLAAHEADGTHVALKVLRPQLSADPDFRRRFVHEARSAAAVQHPNLLPILDQGEVDGSLFLAMRYAPGGSVGALIRATSMLSMEQTVAIGAGVGAGLDALHGAGIMHRDIKPSNVVLLEDGTPAVTDFGLAKGPRYTTLTRIGRPLGTLAYLAPELIAGGAATPASDIYAMGCLAYECLTGAPPFRARGFFELAFAHLHQAPEPLRSVRPDVPLEVEQVVLAALAKTPADRPPSAGEFGRVFGAAV